MTLPPLAPLSFLSLYCTCISRFYLSVAFLYCTCISRFPSFCMVPVFLTLLSLDGWCLFLFCFLCVCSVFILYYIGEHYALSLIKRRIRVNGSVIGWLS